MKLEFFTAACLAFAGCATSATNEAAKPDEEMAMAADTRPIVVEETYAASPAVVWGAITDPEQMRQWFFEPIETFEPQVGFQTQFNVNADGRDFVHVWKVTDVVPNKKIAYTFNYEGFDGDALVVWELAQAGSGTKLTVTHTGLHTFPQEIDAFKREAGVTGWEYFLGDSLKAYLEP